MTKTFSKWLFLLIEAPIIFYFIISQNLNTFPAIGITCVISWNRRIFQSKYKNIFKHSKICIDMQVCKWYKVALEIVQNYTQLQLCLKRNRTVCVFVCLYMYVNVYIYIFTPIYIYIYIYTYILYIQYSATKKKSCHLGCSKKVLYYVKRARQKKNNTIQFHLYMESKNQSK